MKQTLEEAAKENILFNHRTVDRNLSGKDLAKFGEINFVQGAEWQKEQSPWISVKERLPGNNDNAIYINYLSRAIGIGLYVDNQWYEAYTGIDIYGVTHWMPIPSFEDILEANRDVLERMKNKGD